MLRNGYFCFGSIVRKFSFRGEVILRIQPEYFFISKKVKHLYIERDSEFILFSIVSKHPYKNNSLRISVEGINSEEDAKTILAEDVYLPCEDLPPLKGVNFYSHEVIGFKVFDAEKGSIGSIEYVNHATSQRLFEIKKEETLILIPAIKEFIEKIDREKKEVYVKTPQELLDLYL